LRPERFIGPPLGKVEDFVSKEETVDESVFLGRVRRERSLVNQAGKFFDGNPSMARDLRQELFVQRPQNPSDIFPLFRRGPTMCEPVGERLVLMPSEQSRDNPDLVEQITEELEESPQRYKKNSWISLTQSRLI
jgi:hypothetical protein